MKPIPTNDIYDEALSQYVDTNFTQALEKEFEVKPYHVRYKVLYWVAIAFTFLFNFLSFSTGAILVYFFLSAFLYIWLAGTLTAALAILLEIAKRKTVSVWAKGLFLSKKKGLDLLFVILVLSAISITGSYYGAEKGIKEFTPNYLDIQADTLKEVIELKAEIAKLETDVSELKKQTDSKGTIYYKLQPSVNAKELQLTALQAELLDIKKEYRTTNTTAETEHDNSTMVTASNVALIAVFCEVFFILLASWCKYYRYKSYKVLTAIQQAAVAASTVAPASTPTPASTQLPTNSNQTPTPANSSGNGTGTPTPVPAPSPTGNGGGQLAQLKRERTRLKKQRSAWNSKLKKGEGTDATNREHIQRLSVEIDSLEQRIRELQA